MVQFGSGNRFDCIMAESKPETTSKNPEAANSEDEELKTPPFPTNSKRQTNDDEKKENSADNSEHQRNINKLSNPKKKKPNNVNIPTKKYRKHTHKVIPESEDSENEEDIIEERRRQRKQLIKKLNTAEVEPDKKITETKTDIEQTTLKKEISETNKKVSLSQDDNTAKVTDMFAEKDEFVVPQPVPDHVAEEYVPDTKIPKWDNEEGYYKVDSGDLLNSNRYVVKNILGQGIFATVVSALDKDSGNSHVAIKIARNNETIYHTALKEVTMLRALNNADPEDRQHCIQLIRYFMHKGHLCLVLEAGGVDLRSILKRYTKNYGFDIKCTALYTRQLIIALRHLWKVGIIHADIKPENILINEKKSFLKLCDFGSAEKIQDVDPKPYLVSRYYRAPEIIMGLAYGHGVDLWSSACTIYEMATSKILFTGSSNNKMLKCFIEVKGKIPNKMIKLGKYTYQHFNYNNHFLLHKKDQDGRDKVVEVNHTAATRHLLCELKQFNKSAQVTEQKKLILLKDFLEKTLMIDPNYRLSLTACLKHPFLQ